MKPLAVAGVGWITDKNGRDPMETKAQPSIVVCVDGDEEREAKENVADCLVPRFLLNLGKRRSFSGTQGKRSSQTLQALVFSSDVINLKLYHCQFLNKNTHTHTKHTTYISNTKNVFETQYQTHFFLYGYYKYVFSQHFLNHIPHHFKQCYSNAFTKRALKCKLYSNTIHVYLNNTFLVFFF